MDIKTLLPHSHIIYNVSGSSRREILCSLCEPLVTDGVVTDLDSFLNDVENREQQYTTQVGASVALPHARSNFVKRLGCTVGIAEQPVTYDATAEVPCRLFFMIAVPAFAPTAHLPLLQHFASFAHDQERIQKLLDTPSAVKAARQIVRFKP